MKRERILYLDILKAFAICAVLVDHFYMLFPKPDIIGKLSYFSVSVFIIAAGIAAYMTMPKYYEVLSKKSGIIKYFFHRTSSLFLTYALAVFIYYGYDRGLNFGNMQNYIHILVEFSVPAPAYYIVVYAQMVLISPILYVIIKKSLESRFQYLKLVSILAAALGLGYFLTIKGPTFPFYGGGGDLLGGSYLFLYVIGMIWSALDIPNLIRKLRFGSIYGLILLVACGWRIGHSQFAVSLFPAWRINPPGVVIMVYAAAIVWCITDCTMRLERIVWIRKRLLEPFAWIGRYSLDIFLYHWIIHNMMRYQMLIDGSNLPERILLYLIPLFLPILLRFVYTAIKENVRKDFAVWALIKNKE